MSEQSAFGLGDVVGNESGVHKRSFGPGSSRPIVRGFDGDRVLVLMTGFLPAHYHRNPENMRNRWTPFIWTGLKVVKGPATLLYGSNAIGGVVNMVTEHHYAS